MAYVIEYYYQTGNSFGSENLTEILEFEFDTYEIAEKAFNRIEEHWEWCYSVETQHIFKKEVKEPSWLTEIISTRKGKLDWFEKQHTVVIPVGDGTKTVQFSAPWCGYFERLLGIRILFKGKERTF